MEANPEDVTRGGRSAAWRALGVNRLSIGVQSFHDGELAAISRVHDRARALEAVRAAVAAGVRTNLDLMLGLPEQTAESFRATLDTAIDLGAGHLSLYMLDLEEKTPLQVQVARGRVALPEDDLVADLYIEAIEHLASRGLAAVRDQQLRPPRRGVPPQSSLLDPRPILRLRHRGALVHRWPPVREHARHASVHRHRSGCARLQ